MGALDLDSSVVIALFDPTDVRHHASTSVIRAARDNRETMILPASVLSEDKRWVAVDERVEVVGA